MANKPRSEIYDNVVQLLKTGQHTILQIADKTGVTWETAKNAVETLKTINLITSLEQNGKTYYQVDEAHFLQRREDTLLGLPLTAEQEKATKALFTRIKLRWETLTGRPISKTFLQKILVRVVDDNKIPDVPYGWYLFGECAVLFTAENDGTLIKQFDNQIDAVVKEYATISNTNELLQTYYTKKGNELYLLRLRISNLLLEPFRQESLERLKKTLRDFLFAFPRTEENTEIVENLNAYASMAFRLINQRNEKEMEDIRSLLNDTFSSLWESIATYNLYHSLKDKGWYDTPTLLRYYRLRIEIVKEIVENYLSLLNDHTPTLELQKDNPINKFKGIQE